MDLVKIILKIAYSIMMVEHRLASFSYLMLPLDIAMRCFWNSTSNLVELELNDGPEFKPEG